MNQPCFCGSNFTFENCCKPIIEGTSQASTAEQLMRSRYCGYSIVAVQYLLDSTHISERANYSKTEIETWAEESTWQKLEIVACENGLAEDSVGKVEFKAYFKDSKNVSKIHHEKSIFQKENGIWYFVSGEIVYPKIHDATPDRNASCPCGSGKKFKKCCG